MCYINERPHNYRKTIIAVYSTVNTFTATHVTCTVTTTTTPTPPVFYSTSVFVMFVQQQTNNNLKNICAK